MGVKIFRDNNWSRILCGIVSGGDILRLDAERDEELIKFLLLRLPEQKRGTMNCGFADISMMRTLK